MADGDVEKLIADQRALDARKHELIREVLRQKEAAIREFDEKLEKLGYDGTQHVKRSHHKAHDEPKPE